ncbi:hypothetical protein H4R26_001790 [Coemansia thaxteri]|uniref:ER membrane protein complex subunit 1 n=1 Tax=Coemansia thaxteri TaxID=2663907 RepID=A0A9W8EK61_9FUNG|nr:hypothetical protein H4R26_001790 [Coemansia thaxteri]KAJ2486066.1 hypothetical protein EV174_001341 [Coemansia sp. RSA 2320]
MLGGSLLTRVALAGVLAASTLSTAVQGLFPDEAGQIDWHRAQVGAPKMLIPCTHDDGSTSILAITDRNVLASLSSDSGEIVWRQLFDPTERINVLKLRGRQVLTHSGTNETHVRVWDAQSGALAWGFSHPPSPKHKSGSGAAAFLRSGKDVLAVVGDSLVRLAPEASKPVWELPLNRTATFKRLVVQESVAFVIGHATLTNKNPTPRLHVVEVNLKTGLVKQQYDVANEQALGSDSLVILESEEYGGYIVWRERKNIVWNIHRLGMQQPMWDIYHAKLVQMELMPESMLTSTISELDTDSGLGADKPRFVMKYTMNDKVKSIVVEMFRVGDELKLRKIVGFRSDNALVAGSNRRALPSGEASPSERAVVAVRSSEGDISWRIYTSGKTPAHTGEFVYDTATYGPISAAYLYYAGAEPRVLVQTKGGLLAALASGSSVPLWFRDESLAHATDMVFLELPAPASLGEHAAKATDPSVISSPVSRYIQRWIETARSLAAWSRSGFGVFGGSGGSGSSKSGPNSVPVSEELVPKTPLAEGDHFGFRKLSIFGTSTGIVAALSTQDGARSWTRYLSDSGAAVSVDRVFITRRSQPLINTPSLLAVVGRNVEGRAVVAVLNALTGEILGDGKLHVLPYGYGKVVELPVVDTASEQQLLGLVINGPQPQLAVWPATIDAAVAFCAASESIFFDIGAQAGSGQLDGYRARCPEVANLDGWGEDTTFATDHQWSFELPAGETLVAASEYHGAQTTALQGRILGDRSVLYKYVNPHLITLASHRDAGGIVIYFVDRVSGRLLYSSVHETGCVSSKRPFLVTQSENRVIYQFWQDSDLQGAANQQKPKATKGYVTVVAELFESDKPDTRDAGKTFSSLDLHLPHVITTAFTAPESATALGVTRTGSHITTRDVLFGLSSGKLLSLPDQLFDPRRPKRAQTKDEQAEGLLPYSPSLLLDPKRVLSHRNVVAGIARIMSAPTHLESTSLVASYGLDLFFTRTSPSGTFDQLSPSFSKVNLVVTTLALVVGCLLGGPMVRRKLTNQAWA